MDGCHGGGDRVFTQESDMRVSWATSRQESHRLQIGAQKETSGIKKRTKVQGLLNCKGVFTTEGDWLIMMSFSS